MIRVYYTQAAIENSSPAALESWTLSAVEELPSVKRAQILRLRPPHSRFNSALGWQLVKFGFSHSGYSDFKLSLLQFDERRKPHWPGGKADFNLSHSESLLACALADQGRVGIDVEYVRPLQDSARMFEQILSPGEIPSACEDQHLFFQYWTRKEAVIKAEGSGGVWNMPQVRLRETEACYKNTDWKLYPLELAPGYAACVASEYGGQDIRTEPVEWQQLINNQG